MSLWFYGYFNPSYLPIICGSIIGNYLISRLIIRCPRDKMDGGDRPPLNTAKIVTALGIILNAAVLFYFKYVDFFIYNINRFITPGFALRNIVLPLGISFFTFQQMSFIIDTYNGETKGYGFLEYAVFVAFFPQLVAGPIVLHSEIIPQLRNPKLRTPDSYKLSRGLWLFAVGLAKKVIIADTLGNMVTLGFGGVEILSSIDVILVGIAYAFQMYYDFSGYSDMATGLASLFGIELPLNFDSPFKCNSVSGFWSGWHLTLTRFLRKYIYIPLGGSKKGELRCSINIMIVFLVSGFWHGAGWTYIIWGAMHGVGQVLHRKFKDTWDNLNKVFTFVVNFIFLIITFIMFRAENFNQAYIMYRKVIKLESFAITDTFLECLTLPEIRLAERLLGLEGILGGKGGLHMWGFLAVVVFMTYFCKNAQKTRFKCNVKTMLATAFMLSLSIVSFSGISTFLYFNF